MLNQTFARLRRSPGLFVSYVMTRPLIARDGHAAGPGPLVYRLCEPAELLGWSVDPELELGPAKIEEAFGRGDACVGAFEGERLVGYVWYSYGDAPHCAGIWVRIPREARYAYKALLRRSCRGKGWGKALYEHCGAVSPQRGRSLGITFIYVDNLASIRPAEQAGWCTVGVAGHLGNGRLFLPFRSPSVRRLGFAFFRPSQGRSAAVGPAVGLGAR
jgi:hypothetical protein